MRKIFLMMATLVFMFSLAACSGDDHGHNHGDGGDHSHDKPEHHETIE